MPSDASKACDIRSTSVDWTEYVKDSWTVMFAALVVPLLPPTSVVSLSTKSIVLETRAPEHVSTSVEDMLQPALVCTTLKLR